MVDNFSIGGFRGSILSFYNTDFIEGSKEVLLKDSVDVVFTSPPYNLEIDYSSYHDDKTIEEYLKWTSAWVERVFSCLPPEGSFFLNFGGPAIKNKYDPNLVFRLLDLCLNYFKLQNSIIWVKAIGIKGPNVPTLTIGHYTPIGGTAHLNNLWEYVFHFTKTGKVDLDRLGIGVRSDKPDVNRSGNYYNVHCRGNVWFCPYETIVSSKKQRPHPAAFPTTLPEMGIRLHGLDKTSLVLDPFSGIGSTGVACSRLGKSFVGFEIDKGYFKAGCDRVSRELGSKRALGEKKWGRNSSLKSH